jgi:hypothetical protein
VVLLQTLHAEAARLGADPIVLGRAVEPARSKIVDLAEKVRTLCHFSDETAKLLNEKAWWLDAQSMDAEAISSWLTLLTGFLEEPPLDLNDPAEVRRLALAGLDSQAVELLHALVRAVLRVQPATMFPASEVVGILDQLLHLPGIAAGPDVATIYRMWRAGPLRELLRPDRGARNDMRQDLRAVARRMEEALNGPMRVEASSTQRRSGPGDLQILTQLEAARALERMYFPEGGFSPEAMVDHLRWEATVMGIGDIRAEEIDGWWVVEGEDWLPPGHDREVFARFMSFPEAGLNASRLEVFLSESPRSW